MSTTNRFIGKKLTNNEKSYFILKLLSDQGTTGEVYLGVDNNKKIVAIKIFYPEFSGEDDIGINEIICLKKIKDICSEDILCYIDDFYIDDKDDKRLVIITEFIKGYIDLDKYLETKGNITLLEYNDIISKLKEIIKKIHDIGIAHNDLNLGNILIHPITGKLRLLDFGTCEIKATSEDFTNELLELSNTIELIKDYVKQEDLYTNTSKKIKSDQKS